MLAKIVMAAAAVLVVLVAVVAMQPSTYLGSRATAIAASQADAFVSPTVRPCDPGAMLAWACLQDQIRWRDGV